MVNAKIFFSTGCEGRRSQERSLGGNLQPRGQSPGSERPGVRGPSPAGGKLQRIGVTGVRLSVLTTWPPGSTGISHEGKFENAHVNGEVPPATVKV